MLINLYKFKIAKQKINLLNKLSKFNNFNRKFND